MSDEACVKRIINQVRQGIAAGLEGALIMAHQAGNTNAGALLAQMAEIDRVAMFGGACGYSYMTITKEAIAADILDERACWWYAKP